MALQIEPSKKQPSMWPITRWFEKSFFSAAKDPGLPAFPHHSTTNGLRPPNAAGSMHQEANCQQQPTAFAALQVLSKRWKNTNWCERVYLRQSTSSENTRNEVVESKNSFKHLYNGNKPGEYRFGWTKGTYHFHDMQQILEFFRPFQFQTPEKK